MSSKKPKFKKGDLVVAETSPNTVQRVHSVKITTYDHGPGCRGSHEFVVCHVVWRLDAGPYSKTPMKPQHVDRLRLADMKELRKQAEMLLSVCNS